MKSTVTDANSGKVIEYTEPFWSSKNSLTVNGVICERVNRKTFLCKEDKQTYTVKGNVFTGMTITSRSVNVEVVRLLSYWEYILCVIPFLLACWGVLGGVIGIVFMLSNILLIRKIDKFYFKILTSLGFLVVGYGLYLLLLLISGSQINFLFF